MIKEIRITNFGPYREEVIFDFTTGHGKNNTKGIPILKTKKADILKIVGIFGKNASGKSILIDAISIIYTITVWGQLPKTNPMLYNQNVNEHNFFHNPNIFSENSNTTISIILIIDDIEYSYKLIYNENGINYEQLVKNSKTIFTRKESIVKIGKQKSFKGLANITSFFGIIKSLNFPQIKECKPFVNKMSKIVLLGFPGQIQNFKQSQLNKILSDFEAKAQKQNIDLNTWVEKYINRLIKFADLSLDGIYINKTQGSAPGGIVTNYLLRPIPTKVTQLSERHLNINMSTGTKEYLFCLLALLHSDHNEYLIFWDEFGSPIHPQLTSILILLASESNKKTQLIFNTNQASIINRLNRLQIFMLDRHDNDGTKVWRPKSKDTHNRSIYKAFLEGTIPGGLQIDWDELLESIENNE